METEIQRKLAEVASALQQNEKLADELWAALDKNALEQNKLKRLRFELEQSLEAIKATGGAGGSSDGRSLEPATRQRSRSRAGASRDAGSAASGW